MSLTDISRLGFGGAGIPDTLPAAVVELQNKRLEVVDGAVAGTKMRVTGMAPEDTIAAVVDWTNQAVVNVSTLTLMNGGFTSTVNLGGMTLLVLWIDKHPVVLTPYQRLILAAEPTRYWPLDDPASTRTARDLAGNEHGTLNGDVIAGVPWKGSSTVMEFSKTGSTGWIAVPDLPLTPQITLEAWVKPEVEGAIISRQLVLPDESFGYSPSGVWDLFLYHWQPPSLNKPQAFLFVMNRATEALPNNPAMSLYSDPHMPFSEWYHIVATYDGTAGKLFVDNVMVVHTVISQPAEVLRAFRTTIGVDAYDNNNLYFPWKGLLADIAVYPRAITPAEIAAHYAQRLSA